MNYLSTFSFDFVLLSDFTIEIKLKETFLEIKPSCMEILFTV